MKPAARFVALALGSVIYWIAAPTVIIVAAWVVPGDCGTETSLSGLRRCQLELRSVVIVAFTTALLIYVVALSRIVRRR